ncbi:hypothetical protein CFVI02298_04435 [Campylobacter fetus subsp. venerealis cfvi02/298]|uniref:hypothetical protein n=1 Tax=Campylobacter fetus TaxID=196 RepID=UPI0003E3324C|nr:hypothetical protein [Campylobacter fetus]OCS21527.1 hypothetical protein CFVI97532_09280 [Campylobacter fetus subsp. venerealis cfvi97/532]OCS40123.1 hypothetical protein CFVI92203_09170 [Campylobacter fetus subsp. venerealis cfvi92/203]OCS42584.1 hypothetical protein CFVI02298_04435 [Campylobacter fetus subsp. venerealis cfvi02/298]CDF65966.1 conserved hypothetical protein [Campylobacter fetus subsp. venerealis str. 84-112]
MNVYSLEESIAILNKYKNKLTEKEYASIRSVIGNYAIENMFLNEDDILAGIRILQGQATAQEEILKIKHQWNIL